MPIPSRSEVLSWKENEVADLLREVRKNFSKVFYLLSALFVLCMIDLFLYPFELIKSIVLLSLIHLIQL